MNDGGFKSRTTASASYGHGHKRDKNIGQLVQKIGHKRTDTTDRITFSANGNHQHDNYSRPTSVDNRRRTKCRNNGKVLSAVTVAECGCRAIAMDSVPRLCLRVLLIACYYAFHGLYSHTRGLRAL